MKQKLPSRKKNKQKKKKKLPGPISWRAQAEKGALRRKAQTHAWEKEGSGTQDHKKLRWKKPDRRARRWGTGGRDNGPVLSWAPFHSLRDACGWC